LKPSHKDIDINLPNITNIDHYPKLQMKQENKKRSEVIEEARKKYFFYEGGTPTFRIMEEYDDRGNPIEEPELWRPVGMDINAYNRSIEVMKYILYHFLIHIVFDYFTVNRVNTKLCVTLYVLAFSHKSYI